MVSVVIPLFNAEKTICDTLESVRSQTYSGLVETIVVDDGSTDASAAKVQAYQVLHPEFNLKLIQQQNSGVSSARNTGIKASSGSFIALLDSDDVWFPKKLEKQMTYLNKHPDTDFVAARRTGQKILPPYKVKNGIAEVSFRKLLLRNEIITPAVVFRKAVVEKCGLFDADQRYAEDQNYWLRMALSFKMVILDDVLLETGGGKRSFGVSGLSANLAEMEKGFQKNLRDIYHLGAISKAELLLYKAFYRIKYAIRLARNFFFNLLKK